MANQPTILVKKTDGTSVRMTLAEIQAMKESKNNSNGEVHKKSPLPNTVTTQAKKLLLTPELEPAPAELLLTDTEPHLLHEEVQTHEIARPELVASVSYDDIVATVLKQSGLQPAPELMGRIRSLIISLLKGVRTATQVQEYAQSPIERGGLGLSPDETTGFLNALQSTPGLPHITLNKIPENKKNISTISVPQHASMPLPQTTMYTTAIRAMRDVEAPPQTPQPVMGPVEEMKNFSLLDWRRLAATPDKAKEIILAKFRGWQSESFFMYRDTRLAWLSSPLIRQYQATIVAAINANTRLSDAAAVGAVRVKETLSPADIAALVEVNRVLAV